MRGKHGAHSNHRISTVTPTLKDLITGIVKKAYDASVFWWTEGNGSCDCNRSIVFGKHEEMTAAQRVEHPELERHQGYCFGCKRFIAIDVDGDLEGLSKEKALQELNRGYAGKLSIAPGEAMTIDDLIAHWDAARFETKGATVNIPYGATRKALLGLRNAIVPILNTASPSLAKANHVTVHNQLIGELRAALQADYALSATPREECK